jgi:hypothetical protein
LPPVAGAVSFDPRAFAAAAASFCAEAAMATGGFCAAGVFCVEAMPVTAGELEDLATRSWSLAARGRPSGGAAAESLLRGIALRSPIDHLVRECAQTNNAANDVGVNVLLGSV